MARVTRSIAAKDYPAEGIMKGDTYYNWQLFKQPKQRSLTPPRRSQLTGSDKLGRAYDIEDDMLSAIARANTPQEVLDALEEAASGAREVADEYQESADNIGEAFPNGSPTIDDCVEKADNLNAFADECDDAASTIEAIDPSEFGEGLGDSPPDKEWSFDDCAPEVQSEWLDQAKNDAEGITLNI